MVAVLCAPGEEHVVCLDPEFITPQDGHEKQDCEQQAIKRWVERNSQRFEPWSVTILADDLHCHHPLCKLLLKHKLFHAACVTLERITLFPTLSSLDHVRSLSPSFPFPSLAFLLSFFPLPALSAPVRPFRTALLLPILLDSELLA